MLAIAPYASAQEPPDSVTSIARQRYAAGVKAYDAGHFDQAREAFAQAYALKRHPAVLLNLGQSELRSGHPDEAGNHLQQFLREHTTATADERTAAEKGLAEAKKRSGAITIAVDAPGADISLDGATIGKSPLADAIFVKPGTHTVFATLEGKSAAASIEVKAGAAATATLALGVAPAPPPGPPAPPAPPEPPAPPVPAPPPAVAPPAPPPPIAPAPMPPPAPVADQRLTFGAWYSHRPVAWVGTGLAGLGLVGGIAFSLAASGASSASKTHAAQINAESAAHPEYNPTKRTNLCGDADGNGAIPQFAAPCALLQSDIHSYHTDVALAATSWVLFGVGVAGTAMYAMIDWYPNRSASPRDTRDARAHEDGVRWSLVPIAGPSQRGLGVVGTF